MKTINIFGGCVSRDIFDEKCIQNPDVYEKNLYQVQQYAALASPMSLYQPPPENKLSMEDLAGFAGPNFRKRCMVLDHNKACFDYLRQKQSDYLVMDIADARLSVAQYQQTRFLSCAILYRDNHQKLSGMLGAPVIHRFNDWSTEAWETCMNWYCDQILELYPPEKIILLELLRTDEYLDKSGRVQLFPEAEIQRNHAMNAFLNRLFSICARRLAGCHTVKMPDGVFSDASHKLGLLPMHYHCLYYEYAFRALRIITQEQPDAEAEKLEALRGDYSTRFTRLRIELAKMEDSESKRIFLKGGAMEHYDIGIYGVWPGCNYGSVMTYYALHQTFSSMGKSVLMIDKPILSDNDVEFKSTHARRFAREYYHISQHYHLNEMPALNKLCDTFVMGSDQVWNYGISRNFGKTYYLDFVEEGKKKLACAASFGHGIDFAPPEERVKIAALMSRFDGISVREADGVRLCRDDYGIRAEQVLDPVFWPDPAIYQPLIARSSHQEKEPFLAAYILDPTPEKREAILYLAKELGGLKVINLLDGLPWKFQKNRELTNLPNCVENLQAEDWLYYLSHAQFVLTDSCHGASFAMLFHRNFLSVVNKARGFSRFDSLSLLFGFRDRLITDPKRILTDRSLLHPVDFQAIDAIMKQERERSLQWLREHLERPVQPAEVLRAQNIIYFRAVAVTTPAESCTGCGACVGVCPKDALSLKPDAHGYYRRAIKAAACVNCGKCTAICPALKLPENRNTAEPDCFAFQAADTALLYASSSGGAFGVLAGEAFRRGGAVAGVAWSGDRRDPGAPPKDWKDDFHAVNVLIDRPEALYQLQRSKYMQSDTGNICRQVKEKLDAGTFVLFTGTPCQTAGLRAYLGKDNDNLLIVDILCGNAPSQLFFQKYLSGAFPDGIEAYQFRHKVEKRPWDCTTVMATDRNGQSKIRRGGREDDYQRLYHSHVMCPKHCEQCRYQQLPRFGDLTIGDFWGIQKHDPQIDTQKGVSVILCGSEKGRAFLDSLPKSEIGLMKKVPLDWLGGNGYALPGKHNWTSPKRGQFYENILHMPFREAADRALKPDYAYLETLPAPERKPALRFDTHFLHFRFQPDIWEEAYVDGNLTLFVRPERAATGHYASLPLYRCLEKGRAYVLKTRFKIHTDSDVINFHVKDSGSALYQVIHSHKLSANRRGIWQNIEIVFRPASDLYDEFMIGAAQIRGPERSIAFQYIYIFEKEET